jgi:hypothetical protein
MNFKLCLSLKREEHWLMASENEVQKTYRPKIKELMVGGR